MNRLGLPRWWVVALVVVIGILCLIAIEVTLCHADELRWFQPTIPGTGQPIPNAPGALILTPHTTRPPGDIWIIPTVPGTAQIAPGGAWGLILDLDGKDDEEEDDE